MSEAVSVRRGADHGMVSWSLDEERYVLSLVEKCLKAAQGSWHATVVHSAALTHCWVVQIVREDAIGSRSVLLDARAPQPDEVLRRAIAEIGSSLPRVAP